MRVRPGDARKQIDAADLVIRRVKRVFGLPHVGVAAKQVHVARAGATRSQQECLDSAPCLRRCRFTCSHARAVAVIDGLHGVVLPAPVSLVSSMVRPRMRCLPSMLDAQVARERSSGQLQVARVGIGLADAADSRLIWPRSWPGQPRVVARLGEPARLTSASRMRSPVARSVSPKHGRHFIEQVEALAPECRCAVRTEHSTIEPDACACASPCCNPRVCHGHWCRRACCLP